MTSHEIFVSVLRKHLIARKIADQIATEVDAALEAEYDRSIQEMFHVKHTGKGENNGN
jgi:hypothetical protein